MCTAEHFHQQPELSTAQSEKQSPQSWAEYICQLGNQFQVRITQPGDTLRLGLRDNKRQLLVATHSTFVVIVHGETNEEGVMSDAEIVFDVTGEGKLAPNEILYTPEVWEDFQSSLRKSSLPLSDECSFDGERFAAYLLNKIACEEWIDISSCGLPISDDVHQRRQSHHESDDPANPACPASQTIWDSVAVTS